MKGHSKPYSYRAPEAGSCIDLLQKRRVRNFIDEIAQSYTKLTQIKNRLLNDFTNYQLQNIN